MGLTEELFGKESTEDNQTQQKTDETTSTGATDEPEYYTEEQLAALHPTQIDIEKVDPKFRPLIEKSITEYKKLQKDYTKKSTELAEKSKTEQKGDGKQKTWEDHFEENPQGTLTYIDGEIAKLRNEARKARAEGDNSAAFDAMEAIEGYNSIRSSLIVTRMLKNEETNKRERDIERSLKTFPDYETKRESLIAFIVQSNPEFSEDEAAEIIDANKGLSNIKLAKLLSKIVDKATVEDSTKNKIIKKTPKELGRPGGQGATGSSESAVTQEDYDKEFEKAKKTGDWSKVLEMKGAV